MKESRFKRFYRKHRARRLQEAKEYYRKNKPRCRATQHAYRHGSSSPKAGHFTAEDFEELRHAAGYACVACGAAGPLEADHIVPLALGGSNDIKNIQPLCPQCNRRKGAKTINYMEGESA